MFGITPRRQRSDRSSNRPVPSVNADMKLEECIVYVEEEQEMTVVQYEW